MRNTHSPHPVHKLINGHRMIHRDQQCHQHTPLPSMAKVNSLPVDPQLDITKQPELHRHADHPRPRRIGEQPHT